MPLNFSTNGSVGIIKPPRIVTTTDAVTGCPPTRAVGASICSTTITLSAPGYIIVEGRFIRICSVSSGRCDTILYIGSTVLGRSIDNCDGATTEWVQHVVSWAGDLAAGTYTFQVQCSCANAIGCGGDWGHLQFLIFE